MKGVRLGDMANAEHVPRLARHGDIKLTQLVYTDYESLAGGSGRRRRG